MIVLYLLVTGVAAFYCLLAVWAATGRGHWFLRACVLLVALALLVPIRAYEPLILFGMTSALLVIGWSAANRFRMDESVRPKAASPTPRLPYRFGLSGLLLACAIAAGVSWLVSVMVENNVWMSWWRVSVAAILLATLTSQTNDIVRWQRPWWSMLLLGLTVVIASVIDALVLGNWLFADELLQTNRSDPIAAISPLLWLYGGFAAWLLLMSAAAMSWRWKIRSAAMLYAARAGTVLAALPLAFLLCVVYWQMLEAPRGSVNGLSGENALPRVIELARTFGTATPREADVILSELLPLLERPGFVEPSTVRPDFGTEDGQAELTLPRILARGLMAQSDALRGAREFDAAADHAMAILRLGEMFGRNGTAHHRLEAEALFHMGHAKLAECRRGISTPKAREAAHLVRSISSAREPITATVARDAALTQVSKTWRNRLEAVVLSEMWGRPAQPNRFFGAVPPLVQKNQVFARLLALDLLLRAHRAEHGAWPITLEEVVPPDATDMMEDPYALQTFVYRPAKPEFVLYSIGKDGKDDGGRFSNHMTADSFKRIDVDTDTLIRP